MLAGIGSVESDHGRSTAPGVSSGQNFHGCCAGPMQIHNGFGAGDGDLGRVRRRRQRRRSQGHLRHRRRRRRPPRDYLRASGAPGDWHRALFAYNHDQSYVAKVLELAAQYRAAAKPAPRPAEGAQVAGDGRWLADVPGFPGERCDARIVADVVALTTEFGLHLSDCYGGAPHDTRRRASARPGRRHVAEGRQLVAHDAARSDVRLVAVLRRAGLPGPRAVPRRSLQRLSGSRRSAAQRDPAHPPVLAARARASRSRAPPWVRVLIATAAPSASKSSSSSRTSQPRRPERKEK